MQVDKDKIKALQGIFGSNQDFTTSFIHNVLAENGNKLDDAVDALLSMSDSKEDKEKEEDVILNEPVRLDGKEAEKIQTLENMFGGDLTKSVICTVFHSNKGELEDTVDTLLNMTSSELNPVADKRQSDNEKRVQEQEIQKYEEWKRLQQIIQEAERKAIQENQRAIELEKERLKKQQEEHQKVMQQQELLLKKAAEEQKKKEEERKRQLEEKKRLLEEKRREEERIKMEDERKKAEEAIVRKRREEEEMKRMAEEERQRGLLEQARLRAEQKVLEVKLQKEAEVKLQKEAEEARKTLEAKLQKEEEARKKAEEQERMLVQKLRMAAEDQRKKETEEKEKERLKQEAEKKRITEEKQNLEMLLLRVEEERKIMEEQRQREREERVLLENRMKEEQELLKKNWEQQLRVLREKEEAMKAEKEKEKARKLAEELARTEKRLQEERLKEKQRFIEEQRKKEELLMLEKLREEREKEEQQIKEELRMKEEQILREQEERKKEEEEEEKKKQEKEEEEKKQKEEEERKKQELSAVIEDENGLPLDTSAVFIPSALNDPSTSQNKNNPLTVEVVEDKVTCSWNLENGFNPSNWLGLYVADQDDSYVKALYTKGEQAGQQVFKKVVPGHYEIRFFTDRSSLQSLARSEIFTVGPMATISAQLQAEHLLVHYAFDPLSNTPTTDWLGIYEKKEKKNKNYVTTGYGNREGRVLLKAPRKPGVYEVRLFVNGGYNDQARAEFTVEDHDCVNIEPNTVLSGANVNVTWILRTIEPASGDWVGLYRVGEANNKNYLQCLYTNGTSVGVINLQAPKEAGAYEMRLFARNVGKYVTFRTSPSFNVM